MRVAWVLTIILPTIFLTGDAMAHGHNFRGGNGGRIRPEDVPDPRDPRPPPLLPSTLPNTPPDGPPGPPDPAPPAPPVVRRDRKIKRPPPLTFLHWSFWWAYNRDDHVPPPPTVPDPVRREIRETLLETVGDQRLDESLRGTATIALARCRVAGDDEVLCALAGPESGAGSTVRESATLGLGIFGSTSPATLTLLRSLSADREQPYQIRCLALLSLGLLRDTSPETTDILLGRLSGDEATPDVPVSALVAVGISGNRAAVPILIGWLEAGRVGTNRLNDLERSWILWALGRIGDPRALLPCVERLQVKGLYTRRSAAIAVGSLLHSAAPGDREQAMAGLVRSATLSRDMTTRNFGLIALGRAGSLDTTQEMRSRATAGLIAMVADDHAVRPFAALGLGIRGERPEEIGKLICPGLARRYDPGGHAIALGLLGDRSAATLESLRVLYGDPERPGMDRGAAATALGLLGDREVMPRMLSTLLMENDREIILATAEALRFLRETSVATRLLTRIGDPKESLMAVGSCVLALGSLGDPRAAPALLRILRPEKDGVEFPSITRTQAAVALGRLADGARPRAEFRLTRDLNYRACVFVLHAVASML